METRSKIFYNNWSDVAKKSMKCYSGKSR